GSRIDRSHLEADLEQIRLKRRKRALQGTTELLDDPLTRSDELAPRVSIRQQLSELLDKTLTAIGYACTAVAIQRLIHVAEIEDMRTMHDGSAELDGFDRVLSATLDQRAAHEHDRRQPVEQAELAHRVRDIDVGPRHRQLLARTQGRPQAARRSEMR